MRVKLLGNYVFEVKIFNLDGLKIIFANKTALVQYFNVHSFIYLYTLLPLPRWVPVGLMSTFLLDTTAASKTGKVVLQEWNLEYRK